MVFDALWAVGLARFQIRLHRAIQATKLVESGPSLLLAHPCLSHKLFEPPRVWDFLAILVGMVCDFEHLAEVDKSNQGLPIGVLLDSGFQKLASSA